MKTGKLSIRTRSEAVQVPITVVFKATPCTWKVKRIRFKTMAGDLPDARSRFFARRAQVPEQLYEAWDVRQAFLGLQTGEDFLSFLNTYGRLSSRGDYSNPWELRDLKGWQQVLRELMMQPPDTWRKYIESLKTLEAEFDAHRISRALREVRRFTIEFCWHGPMRAALLHTEDVVTAIFATIQVDQLAGTRFRMCARPDCSRFFEITSKHERKYCSQYCAHFESLRRTRKGQKEKRRKPLPGVRRTKLVPD
jgi:hypothetical protein